MITHHRLGFTLLEVLTALLIFSVAGVGVLVNLRDTMGIQNRLLMTSHANELAQNVIEEVKLTGEAELGTQEGDFKAPDDAYTWQTLTEETDVKQLRKVTTTVTWNDGAGSRDVEIVTLVKTRPAGTAKPMAPASTPAAAQ